jgi:predicted ATPase
MPSPLSFHTIAPRASVPSGATGLAAYLNRDDWDDWGSYCTQFYLTVVDSEGLLHSIGQVKIGQRGLKPHAAAVELPVGHRKPNVPSRFEELDDEFFSVGQDEDYYAKLGELGDAVREQVLSCLRDVAFDLDRWQWAKEEDVMVDSLLRSVTSSTVQGQFRRMAHGDARLTQFHFTYSPPKRRGDGSPPFTLDFSVDPESPIPTNVHVIIGRNGVGKTRLLSLMAKALVATDASARQSGKFELNEMGGDGGAFANLVAVSFSAFDDSELLPERKHGPNSLGYSYIGLRRFTGDSPTAPGKPKSPAVLAREFVNSLSECRVGSRRRRWQGIITILQSDPVFRSAELASMIEKNLSKQDECDEVLKTFMALSSGHKIVLLTLTRLVEKVEEKTLVLIDEPEAHLHPPLLSAMTRAISELMVKRNGAAIVATHSPVILQEVPKSCVWILNRVLTASKAERPTMETFAESVGILSREVFQLELAQSGYHQLLDGLRRKAPTYEDAVRRLGGQLGAEGKAVLMGMYLNNDE